MMQPLLHVIRGQLGQQRVENIFMAALRNRAGHYILSCGFFFFFLLSSFFTRRMSAVAD